MYNFQTDYQALLPKKKPMMWFRKYCKKTTKTINKPLEEKSQVSLYHSRKSHADNQNMSWTFKARCV